MDAGSCPVCEAPALHALPPLGPGTLACDACLGFWLDASARAWLSPLPDPDPSHSMTGGKCPVCAATLTWHLFRGPTTQRLAVCPAHGTWFERTTLSAISDPGGRVRIARALLETNRRLPPALAQTLCQTVDVIAARAAGSIATRSIVRPLGNPALVTIGVGAVAPGGIRAISADGTVRELMKPVSRWAMSIIVAVVLGVTLGGVWFYVMLTESFATWLLLSVAFFVTFVLGTGMFVGIAIAAPMIRIEFDSRNRNIDVYENDRLDLRIPYQLVLASRIQLYADQGYADKFDVLLSLGFAELWIEQASSRAEAQKIAFDLANELGAKADGEEERKS